jgi:hypothetical protein
MIQTQSSQFEDRKTAESLLGQAHLCEQIASACSDETAADKFKKLARDCGQAAEDCGVGN